MNIPEDLAITAFIGSFDETELERIEPLKEGEDLFFPVIECAKRLGYHNPRDAIRRHCKREKKTVDEIVVTGRRRDGIDAVQVIHRKYICEGDFYRLLFHSRTPVGEQFADWLTEEVLPSIRTEGACFGRKFARLLREYTQSQKDAEVGRITSEEAETIRREFFEEVSVMAEKLKDSGSPTS